MFEQIMIHLEQFKGQNQSDAVKLEPRELDYLYNLGVKYFKLNNYSQALPLFQIIVAFDNNNPLYLKALAGCFQAQQEFSLALTLYNFTYSLTGHEDQECLFYAAVCNYELEAYQKASEEFNNFICNTVDSELSVRAQLYLDSISKYMEKSTGT